MSAGDDYKNEGWIFSERRDLGHIKYILPFRGTILQSDKHGMRTGDETLSTISH